MSVVLKIVKHRVSKDLRSLSRNVNDINNGLMNSLTNAINCHVKKKYTNKKSDTADL